MKKLILFSLILSFIFINYANAGYYRTNGKDTGRVNEYGTKRCPNGTRVNSSGKCIAK